MGYQIQSYSLNELKRVAIPGTVERTLFWVLPVGRWREADLTQLWRHFTGIDSQCKRYGLMLVKNMPGQQSPISSVNLDAVGAKLSDLLPSGARNIVGHDVSDNDNPGLFVLSGAYPQPGWGVLLDVAHRFNSHDLENIINETLDRMRQAGTADSLEPLDHAARCFRRWQDSQVEPGAPDLSLIEKKIGEYELLVKIIRYLRDYMSSGHYSEAYKAASDIQKISLIAGIDENGSMPKTMKGLQLLAHAKVIIDTPTDQIRQLILPSLDACLADKKIKEEAYRSLSSQGLKDALRACLFAKEMNLVGDDSDVTAWAVAALNSVPHDVREIETLISNATKHIDRLRSEISLAEGEYRYQKERRSKQRQDARVQYHASLEPALTLQSKLAPCFLIEFDRVCRDQGESTKSVAWDPARMIGWKILMAGHKYYPRDLLEPANKLAPELELGAALNENSDDAVDGGLFTDYIHYISSSKFGLAPRDVAEALLTNLTRPTERSQILEYYRGVQAQVEFGFSGTPSVNMILDELGWRNNHSNPEKPLVNFASEEDYTKGTEIGSQIRISLESLCKDIIDVVVSKLNYTQEMLWLAINDHIPNYTKSSRNWRDEVGSMTTGSAAILLEHLLPLAFPDKGDDIDLFNMTLWKLTKVLNLGSHHQENPIVRDAKEPPGLLVKEILACARRILGELPWHLNIDCVSGDQPKVVSGEAWSHAMSIPRQTRVLVCNGEVPAGKILFWNPSGRNPVVPDPVFITRP